MSRSLSRRAWTRGWTLCLAWMASLLMAACGGGGGGGSDDPTVRLDRSSITIDYEAGGPMVPARVTATLDDNGYDGAVYIDAVADGPGISQVLLNFSSDGSTAYADIYVDTSLAPGTYTGTLQVFACKDLACRDELSGSPYRVSFTVNIQAGLSVTPTSSRLTVQSGESAAQSFNVQLQSGASSFTVESLPAWAELVSQDAGSFTLRTRSMPAGVYTGYPVVRAGDRSASLLLELVSNAPSGGEQNLSVSPTSIDFSTTEGGEAVRDLTVTAPSWNPTLTHDVSYTGGAANGWLQVLPTSTGYRLTAQAAGLPAGSYSARMVISGDISTTAQTVYVSLTVGPGLVQVAPRSLEFTSETAADALTGSATIALGAGPTRTWSATSNQSWLVLETASGSTGSALTYHVDASALAAQANGSTRNAQVTVTAAGVITPMTFDVTVTKRLTQLLYASPSVRQAGLAQTILVSGSGFNAVSDLAARVGVAGVSGVTVTRVSDTQLSLALPSLAAGPGFGVQPVDQVDDVEEPAARAAADAGPRDGDRQMALSRTGAADEHGIALLGQEGAGGEIAHQGLVDRRAGEGEVVDILGQGQPGDGELVLDRPRLLLGDLGLEQVAEDPRRFVLALDAGGHDLVIGQAHAVELQRAHQVEDVGPFHQQALRSVS